MEIQIPATEFELVVAMGDLVLWSDASDGPMGHHPQFQAVLDALGARIELTPLVKAYFEDTARAGRGDVHVFELGNDSSAVLAIDAYSEPEDQLDLISLYIRCKRAESGAISELVWKFFNSCSVQAHASQQSICKRLGDAIDPAKFPRSVGSRGFMQSQIRHRVA
ncbi:hypothetical protein RQP53_23450 [Paucibacter sp. APW11]|uniref:Uncharacterized protein n=1 Tax=Roseateles aquae TaxID=3077235 RepID=A0ABU3PI63_9BURK|nr:hypothetical protein [Paucibacter sp. APW11]MDT9002256.1 hypothetical protein [Paucibacter sp. APW11]